MTKPEKEYFQKLELKLRKEMDKWQGREITSPAADRTRARAFAKWGIVVDICDDLDIPLLPE